MSARQGSRARLAVIAVAALTAVAAYASTTARATTEPGFRFVLQVVVTDSGIRLVPHKTSTGQLLSGYIQNGGRTARFPRGTLVQFVFTNKGTKTYLPAIRVTNSSQSSPLSPVKSIYKAPNVIRPGQHVSLYGNFYFRGSFLIEKLLDKKPKGEPIRLSIY
jgi:hypothetical protein